MESETLSTGVSVREKPPALSDHGAGGWTNEEVDLIRNTVAKGATQNEFMLFLYRCQKMGLDPLKPGLIHFVKYGNNPGTIIVGIDGFRSRAARTGKHKGTQRGVLRDAKENCVGAWAEVYRSDWDKPAREEVSLKEYNAGRAQWSKMPETMIKKVAECAALRLAFPDELGGVYAPEEMHQAEPDETTAVEPAKPIAVVSSESTEVSRDDYNAMMKLAGEHGWIGTEITDLVFREFAKQKVSELKRYQFDKLLTLIKSREIPKPSVEEIAAAEMEQMETSFNKGAT